MQIFIMGIDRSVIRQTCRDRTDHKELISICERNALCGWLLCGFKHNRFAGEILFSVSAFAVGNTDIYKWLILCGGGDAALRQITLTTPLNTLPPLNSACFANVLNVVSRVT